MLGDLGDRRADRRSETTSIRDVFVAGLPALVAVMVSVTSIAEKLVPGTTSVMIFGPCVAALCLAIGAAYVVTSRCKLAGKLGGDVLEYRFANATRYCAKILLLPAFVLLAVRVYQCLPYRFHRAWSGPLCGYVCGRGKPLEQAEVDVRDMRDARIGLQLEITDRSGYFCVDVSEWALPPERLRILGGGCKQSAVVEFSEARMASQCLNASEEPVRKGVHRVWEVECEAQ